MSDSLPENEFSGALRVVKLTSGEELIGMVSEAAPDKITIKLPALLENYYTKDQTGQTVEYVKLTNYLLNVRGYEVNLPRSVIVYIGLPAIELEKMYEVYFMAMQTDPKSIVSSSPDAPHGVENGLELLNELFNNEDFVNFVNDMIESFEGVEILEDAEGDEEWDDVVAESPISPSVEEEPEPAPKRKKRKVMKPETNKLPYKPDANPNTAEGWSDNPLDYI
jgi:hypothetical protein